MKKVLIFVILCIVLILIFFLFNIYDGKKTGRKQSFFWSWNVFPRFSGTFKNPANNFAAKLIEESDCKGLTVGDAAVSNHHCNFLINKGNATAKNLEDLGKKIIEKVFNKFNIKLEWEIKIIGN